MSFGNSIVVSNIKQHSHFGTTLYVNVPQPCTLLDVLYAAASYKEELEMARQYPFGDMMIIAGIEHHALSQSVFDKLMITPFVIHDRELIIVRSDYQHSPIALLACSEVFTVLKTVRYFRQVNSLSYSDKYVLEMFAVLNNITVTNSELT